jgi:hypothetical protein
MLVLIVVVGPDPELYVCLQLFPHFPYWDFSKFLIKIKDLIFRN